MQYMGKTIVRFQEIFFFKITRSVNGNVLPFTDSKYKLLYNLKHFSK